MDLHDWLIFLHLLSAFVAIAALVALWAIVLATRPSASMIATDDAMRIGRIAGPMVGAGMGLALVFGVWLSFQIEGYHVWDGWILASIALWLFAAWSGSTSGKLFVSDGVARRRDAVNLQAANSIAVFAILVLMIWKPGA